MVKKRKNPFEDSVSHSDTPPVHIPDEALEALAQSGMVSEEEIGHFKFMKTMVEAGITPDEYELFFNMYTHLTGLAAGHDVISMGRDSLESMDNKPKRTARTTKDKKASPDSPPKTLLLKIQMKGVTKPPMWREVEIADNLDFEVLHTVIQCVTGLDNYHMWQFNRTAYDNSLSIAPPHEDDFMGGFDSVTDIASETPLSDYLNNVGDKLEYTYDFGDDWIFTVSVKKIIEQKSPYPVCTAFKSALNALEDSGGPWEYERYRQYLDDWGSYTTKKRKQIASDLGFESTKDFYEFLQSHIFDLDTTNSALKALFTNK